MKNIISRIMYKIENGKRIRYITSTLMRYHRKGRIPRNVLYHITSDRLKKYCKADLNDDAWDILVEFKFYNRSMDINIKDGQNSFSLLNSKKIVSHCRSDNQLIEYLAMSHFEVVFASIIMIYAFEVEDGFIISKKE